jgi:hypothetical protein
LSERITDLTGGRRTVIFMGEAGCGKSELSINLAVRLKKETDRPVHFFDMDQTKPLFRSRDVADKIRSEGIVFHSNFDLSVEDQAAIAPGVIEAVNEPDSFVIMDIGGNEHGARMIGQFSEYLNRPDSIAFFPINPYRPWSKDLPSIAETFRRITGASRTANIRVISNPNCGPETTAEDVVSGNEKLESMLGGACEISFVCALEHLCPELKDRIKKPLFPVKIYILYPWLR